MSKATEQADKLRKFLNDEARAAADELERLDRVNAELVEASTELKRFYTHIWDRVDGSIVLLPESVDAFEAAYAKFCAALTSATKETT